MFTRLKSRQRGYYEGWCDACDGVVRAEVEDCSFDHAFGTEHAYVFRCEVCNEELTYVDFVELD